jgi:endo-1,4-beta-D-glucanase Y
MIGTRSARWVVLALLLPLAPSTASAQLDRGQQAVAAGQEFLDRYVAADGRVIRRDQGSDTVSEGQAYGMLIAVALGDEARFDQIWRWTRDNLQRADGLFAWRWAVGRVIDWQPATDADLAIASALALAGERFSERDDVIEARRIADAIIDRESVATSEGKLLVAGPWATISRTVNPSYFMINAMSRLLWATNDWNWSSVASTSRRVIDGLTDTFPHLPPDWAIVGRSTTDATATSSPDGRSARYAYDAVRVFVQLAVDCNSSGRAIAARGWTFFRTIDASDLAAEYSLEGKPLTDYGHPSALVAAAASAEAAGRRDAGASLLDAATSLDDDYPTYYGSAWIALGRLWLDTSRLGGCRPS